MTRSLGSCGFAGMSPDAVITSRSCVRSLKSASDLICGIQKRGELNLTPKLVTRSLGARVATRTDEHVEPLSSATFTKWSDATGSSRGPVSAERTGAESGRFGHGNARFVSLAAILFDSDRARRRSRLVLVSLRRQSPGHARHGKSTEERCTDRRAELRRCVFWRSFPR